MVKIAGRDIQRIKEEAKTTKLEVRVEDERITKEGEETIEMMVIEGLAIPQAIIASMMIDWAREIIERGADLGTEGETSSTRVIRTEGEMTGGTKTGKKMVISETSWTRRGGTAGVGVVTGAKIVVIITEIGVGTEGKGEGAGAESVIVTVTKDAKTVGNPM